MLLIGRVIMVRLYRRGVRVVGLAVWSEKVGSGRTIAGEVRIEQGVMMRSGKALDRSGADATETTSWSGR
jgi:hypothetical protein